MKIAYPSPFDLLGMLAIIHVNFTSWVITSMREVWLMWNTRYMSSFNPVAPFKEDERECSGKNCENFSKILFFSGSIKVGASRLNNRIYLKVHWGPLFNIHVTFLTPAYYFRRGRKGRWVSENLFLRPCGRKALVYFLLTEAY